MRTRASGDDRGVAGLTFSAGCSRRGSGVARHVTGVAVARPTPGVYAGAMTPAMPPTRCTFEGCSRLTPSGRSRCPEHATRSASAHSRWLSEHPQDRGPWLALRGRVLEAHPVCQWRGCTSQATDVDHIVEIADGGAFLDEGNVQALCRLHHERKTAIASAMRKAQSNKRRKTKLKTRMPRDLTWL